MRARHISFGLRSGEDIVGYSTFRGGCALAFRTSLGRLFRLDPTSKGVELVEVPGRATAAARREISKRPRKRTQI